MSADASFVSRRLDSIAQVTGGLALGRSVLEREGVEVPYLRVANVQDGYIDTTEVKSVRLPPGEIERYRVRKGDLLLTEGGDLDKLGRGAVWDGRIPVCLHQNHLFRVRSNRDVMLPEYLSLYVSSQWGKRYFLGAAKQTTNLATISSSQLKSMPIPCPELRVQKKILRILDSVTQSERAAEAAIAKMQSVQQGLLSKLLGGVEGAVAADRSSRYTACGDVLKMVGGLPLGQAQSNPVGRYPIFSSGGLAGRGDRQVTGGPAIIIGRVGEGAGSVHFSPESAWVTDNALWVKGITSGGWIPEFIAIYLRWVDLRKYQSQTGQPLITQGVINRVLIPRLDLAEQQKIVRVNHAGEEELQASRSYLAKLRTLRNGIADGFFNSKPVLYSDPMGLSQPV
ncbi:restriction endonuclease subunit S [Streptomyces sp. P11-1]|uniref:restriction endonuclease subunit S n=1 Tax=Streptomyces sp. P11-1 TaxID=3423221 RepID=UPI003D2ECE0C